MLQNNILFLFNINFVTVTKYSRIKNWKVMISFKFYFTITYPNFRLHLETVRLILVLLDLPGNLRHFPSLEEIDQLRIG